MAISDTRLENVGDKRKDTAPPLIKQVREFSQNQLEKAEKKGLTHGWDPLFAGYSAAAYFHSSKKYEGSYGLE